MATITILNTRNINGTYTSPSVRAPATLTGKSFTVITTIPEAQFINPDKSMDFFFEESIDNSTWKPYVSFHWVGGDRLDKDGLPDRNMPGFSLSNIQRLQNRYVRVRVVTPSVLNIAVSVEYNV